MSTGNYMYDIGASYSTSSVRKPEHNKRETSVDLDMTDFLTLMVTQLQSQTIDSTADTSDMLNQLVQMQMVTSMKNVTDSSLMSYAGSLVGKEVTIGKYNAQGKLEETVVTITGSGISNGEYVVFAGDEMYTLSSIMAIGRLPSQNTTGDTGTGNGTGGIESSGGTGSTGGTESGSGADNVNGTEGAGGTGTGGNVSGVGGNENTNVSGSGTDEPGLEDDIGPTGIISMPTGNTSNEGGDSIQTDNNVVDNPNDNVGGIEGDDSNAPQDDIAVEGAEGTEGDSNSNDHEQTGEVVDNPVETPGELEDTTEEPTEGIEESSPVTQE